MQFHDNTSNDANIADGVDPRATPEPTALMEDVVRLEWEQFQRTHNEGGRASCQDNWRTFRIMRLSQFLTWPESLIASWAADLRNAERDGRNLITEKYARMMESTAPDEFRERIAPFLPALDESRRREQERVIAIQVVWARDFRQRYPRLGNGMRVLTTSEDSDEYTSLETYLRGEISTYSAPMFASYAAFIDECAAHGRNLTEESVRHTVMLEGYTSVDDAEEHATA